MSDYTLSDHPYHPILWGSKVSPHVQALTDNFQLSMDDEFRAFAQYIADTGNKVYVRVPMKNVYRYSDNTIDAPKVFLMNHYATGGTHGNGDHASIPYTKDPSEFPSFSSWEQTLCMFWADLPYLGQQRLEEAIKTSVSWTVNEYYGDSSNYIAHMIDLEKLFKVLKKENRLNPSPPEKTFNRFKEFLDTDTSDLVSLTATPAPKPKSKVK